MEQHYTAPDIEPKRLDFGSERKDLPALQNSQVNINENIELNEEMVKYINNQTEYVKDKPQPANQSTAEEAAVQQPQHKETQEPQHKEISTAAHPPPDTKADEMNI